MGSPSEDRARRFVGASAGHDSECRMIRGGECDCYFGVKVGLLAAEFEAVRAEAPSPAAVRAVVEALDDLLAEDRGAQCPHGAEWTLAPDDVEACDCSWWQSRVDALAALSLAESAGLPGTRQVGEDAR